MRRLRYIICLIMCAYLNCAIGLTPRYSAIVIDASSGRVLDQEDADKICHPASLTKMMTLYIVFEALRDGRIRMNTRVPVSAHAARQIPSKLGLRPGESVTVETIIKGLVTKSANDASAAIAEFLGGSEPKFASFMTRKAKSLGMKRTVFKNASGVPNPQQITTARDMATLSRALYLHFPKRYHYFRLKTFSHKGRSHRNHNHLLGHRRGKRFKVDGLKTGYIAASGFNLAASAVQIGRDNKPKRLIAVVLGGPNRHWRDRRVAELLEANFDKIARNPGYIKPTYTKSLAQQNLVDDDPEDNDSDFHALLKEVASKVEHKKTTASPIVVNWPPSTPKSESKSDNGLKTWGVQLGTFASRKEARIMALGALTYFKTGQISTPIVSKGKKSFYGARLLRITKEDAKIACKKFSKSDCRLLSSD